MIKSEWKPYLRPCRLQCLQGQWWDVATYSFPAELSRLPRGEEDGGAGPGLGSSSRRVKVTWLVNQLLQLHFLCLFVHVYRSANASNNDPRLSFKIKTLPVPRHSIATQLERLQPNLSAHLHSQDMWKKEFWPNSPRQTTYWRVTAWPRLMPLEFLSCQSIYTLDHQRRPVPPQSQAEIVLGDLQAHRGSKRIGHHRKFGEIWQKIKVCNLRFRNQHLLRSEKSSTLTIKLTSPRMPCKVSYTGSQPDSTAPP